jgi:hypothetical protein
MSQRQAESKRKVLLSLGTIKMLKRGKKKITMALKMDFLENT